MSKLEVFDPAMCCSTGICGESDDPTLVTFASDLEWIKAQGVQVERYGLALNPAAFINNDAIKTLLCEYGNSCLPVIIFDNSIMHQGSYPSREKLAEMCAVAYNEDEAPPIHREENCCCGQDCDCAHISINDKLGCPVNEELIANQSCNCSNAAAEDNCCCISASSQEGPKKASKVRNIVFVLVILIILGVIAVKLVDKVGASAISEKITDSINFLSQILLTHIHMS